MARFLLGTSFFFFFFIYSSILPDPLLFITPPVKGLSQSTMVPTTGREHFSVNPAFRTIRAEKEVL